MQGKEQAVGQGDSEGATTLGPGQWHPEDWRERGDCGRQLPDCSSEFANISSIVSEKCEFVDH